MPYADPKRYVEYQRKYRRANPEKYAAHNRTYYGANKQKVTDQVMLWRKENSERFAYSQQKHCAKQRDVSFLLSCEEWITWWGDDFDKRGRGREDLVMCRYGDTGPYEIGNIYKATKSENSRGPREKEGK